MIGRTVGGVVRSAPAAGNATSGATGVAQSVDLSCAEAAARALADAMRADPSVVTLGEDIGRGGVFAQYRGLLAEFGAQRVIDTPISESTIMGAAVGMALAGLRPVVELRVVDFALCAMDEIVNQAAKARFMLGGQARVPLVIRLPGGIWSGAAAQHSQSLESWFAHIPGLTVVMPATPLAHYALLRSAIESPDPVLFIEHKELWTLRDTVLLHDQSAIAHAGRIGVAHTARSGSDLTVCTWSRGLQHCLLAAEQLEDAAGIAQVRNDVAFIAGRILERRTVEIGRQGELGGFRGVVGKAVEVRRHGAVHGGLNRRGNVVRRRA